MLAFAAAVCFFLMLLGVSALGPVALLPLGLLFVALHLCWGASPWRRGQS